MVIRKASIFFKRVLYHFSKLLGKQFFKPSRLVGASKRQPAENLEILIFLSHVSTVAVKWVNILHPWSIHLLQFHGTTFLASPGQIDWATAISFLRSSKCTSLSSLSLGARNSIKFFGGVNRSHETKKRGFSRETCKRKNVSAAKKKSGYFRIRDEPRSLQVVQKFKEFGTFWNMNFESIISSWNLKHDSSHPLTLITRHWK